MSKGEFLLVRMTRVLIDQETGEKIFTTKGQNFVKMYIKNMVKMLEAIEGKGLKKVTVLKYILNNIRLMDNTLIKTQRQIAKECNVSLKTVNETLNALSDKGILKKRSGVYMLSPDIFYRGDERRKAGLLETYKLFDKQDY